MRDIADAIKNKTFNLSYSLQKLLFILKLQILLASVFQCILMYSGIIHTYIHFR